MVQVKKISAHELIKSKVLEPKWLLETLVDRFNMCPKAFLFVGPRKTSVIHLKTELRILEVKARPTLLAHEWIKSFRTLRKSARDAGVTYLGPPGFEKVAEEVFPCLVEPGSG